MPMLWLLLACAVGLCAQADPSGHWEGTLQVPDGPSKLVLDLARDEKGVWIASLAVPERQVSGLRAAGLRVEGAKVSFTAPDLPGDTSCELTLADGKLTGTLTVRGTTLALAMQRTGEARVAIAGPSPAVSKQLEGDWSGAIALPDGQTRPVMFHFKNQPDQTVKGTIDSPSQGAQSLELTGIVQKGNAVEFSVRIHGGRYKGTLNAEGTELTGEWLQRPGAPPLTLNMKKSRP